MLTGDVRKLIHDEWNFENYVEFSKKLIERHSDLNIKSKDVQNYLKNTFPYASIAERQKRSKYRKRHQTKRFINTPLFRGGLMMSDTMRTPKGYGGPYKYILGLIDSFSHQIYLEPCSKLKSRVVRDAFANILKRLKYSVKRLVTDAGSVSCIFLCLTFRILPVSVYICRNLLGQNFLNY